MKYITWAVNIVLCISMLFGFVFTDVRAADADVMAQELPGLSCIAGYEKISYRGGLFDKNTKWTTKIPEGAWLTLEHAGGIGSMYLIFDLPYGGYSVTDNTTGKTVVFGREAFLHEFADLEKAFGHCPGSVTITFDTGEASVNEIYLFGPGETPEHVQKWEQPKEGKTDMIVFSTHGDDEHLFFAGILPTYGKDRGCQVQVVYFTDHHNALGARRTHEMLNGLWAVGIRSYPVFGPFDDQYSTSKDTAYYLMKGTGVTEEDMLAYVVEALRRFKPQIVIGHDPINGEYGHGQHMMYADLLMKAVAISADAEYFPEQTDIWGTWDVPKTYLHLWPENSIVMDWDIPLASFDGMTAYQVSEKLGFACHESQIPQLSSYFRGKERAADIVDSSPCQFGLYRTTVGLDTGKGDFMEHLTPYYQQK